MAVIVDQKGHSQWQCKLPRASPHLKEKLRAPDSRRDFSPLRASMCICCLADAIPFMHHCCVAVLLCTKTSFVDIFLLCRLVRLQEQQQQPCMLCSHAQPVTNFFLPLVRMNSANVPFQLCWLMAKGDCGTQVIPVQGHSCLHAA